MLSPTELLLSLLVTVLTAQYLKLQWSRRRYPPGPTPLPIIGNLWTLKFEIRHETLMQLAETYGNIFTVWLGQKPVVVLNGCQTIRDGLLSHSEELSGRPITPLFEEISKGKGVAFTSGDKWKQQRRFALMTLRNLGLGKKILEQRIQEEAKKLVEFFAMKKVFGHRFSSEDKDFLQLMEASEFFANFTDIFWAWLFDAFPWLMRHLPAPHQKIFKCQTFMETFVKKEITRHKENGVPEQPEDFVDYYLTQISKASDDSTTPYDEDNLVHLLVELFVAGMETTNNTLLWALLHMVNLPEIQEKVQKELDTVLEDSEIIQYEDRLRLPYTNAVIHEIQRYSNVTSFGFVRQVVKKTSLQGFNIEKGTNLIANLSSSLYDPAHWKTPRQFNPDHFLDKDGHFVTSNAFLPFSAGHRVCLGEQLARIELFIFFANLLRVFTFRLPEGVKSVNMDYVNAPTLHPHPYQICAVPRSAEKSARQKELRT
ncbi:cytochrome P450 2J6-like isoform X2 [Lissotriton helveticus]